MLQIALCDDEPYTLEALSVQIGDCLRAAGRPDFRLTPFSGGQALLESEIPFDLVFLDVQTPPPDGLDTAAALRRRGERCLVIFLTVSRERVYDAFAVEAFDYLLKPVDPGRLRRTVERALAALERQSRRLIIQRSGEREVVPLADLVYCEVLGRKVYLHKRDGAVLDYYDRLEGLEKRLGSGFFRCHRSYLVNLDRVRGCGGGRVTLDPAGSVPVSRLRERELTQALLRRMGGLD